MGDRKVHFSMERVMGIEPTPSAWKAEVLPLNYTRSAFTPNYGPGGQTTTCLQASSLSRLSRIEDLRSIRTPSPESPPAATSPRPTIWWRGEDSNLRRLSRQIYSLIPLTAREPLLKERRSIEGRPIGVNCDFGRRPDRLSISRELTGFPAGRHLGAGSWAKASRGSSQLGP